MKQALSCLFVFFITVINLYAQKASIKGFIQDTTAAPLEGITIQLEGTRLTAITNEFGQFAFTQLPAGNYALTAAGLGYAARKEQISLTDGQQLSLRLQLNLLQNTLTEVVVRSVMNRSSAVTRTNTPLRDLPQNVQVVDRTVLDDQQAFRLDDALKNVAGITSTDFYGGYTSRGFSVASTTNGMKGSPYPEGQIPLLGNIESVEVLHGPAAILNGPGGLGATLNMVTKQPKKNTTVNATAGVGSLNLFRAMADVTGSITKKKNLYYLLGAGWQNGGKYTDDFYSRNLQVYGAVKWEIAPQTSWLINANYIHDDASNNYQPRVPVYLSPLHKDSIFAVPYTFNPGTDSRYKGNNYQLQSVFEHRLSADWKLNLWATFSHSNAERNQYTASGYVRSSDHTVSRSYTWQQIKSPTTNLHLFANGKIKMGKVTHLLTFGGDVTLAQNNYPKGILQYSANRIPVINPVHDPVYDTTGMIMYSNSRIEEFTYNTVGAYIQNQVEITAQLKLLAAIRYNNYYRRYYAEDQQGAALYDERPERTENFSPRLGLVYQPVQTVSVYISYNEGFTPHYGNYTESGGPFKPETAKEYEAGFKGEFWNGSIQPYLTIYQSTKKNVLQSAPRDGFPYWREAIGEVRSRGAEIGVKGNLFNGLFVNFNYNYNKTKITESLKPEDIGQLFANVPANTANAWLKYTFGNTVLKGLYLGGGFQYVDKRYFTNKKTNAVNVLEMPAYTVMDLFAGYRIKQYSLQFNLNNITDERYALSGITNSYTPGMPRSFLVTVSYALK